MTVFAVSPRALPLIHRAPLEVLLPLALPGPTVPVGQLQEPALWDVFAVNVLTISLLFFLVGLIPDTRSPATALLAGRKRSTPSPPAVGRARASSEGRTTGGAPSVRYRDTGGALGPLDRFPDFAMSIVPNGLDLRPLLRRGRDLRRLRHGDQRDDPGPPDLPARAVPRTTTSRTCRGSSSSTSLICTLRLPALNAYRLVLGRRVRADLVLAARVRPKFSTWCMIIFNVVMPQLLWIKKLRTNLPFLLFLFFFINLGMWFGGT